MFMKKQNKKRGFTVTELVVVVSVIAILSAVLIPTFTGIINKSKMSADQQTVRNMNNVLASIIDDDGKIEYNDIANALDTKGYNVMNNDQWNPSYKGYKAYWLEKKNVIVLVEGDQIIYPASEKGDFVEADATPLKSTNYVAAVEATTATAAATEVADAINAGQSVTLTKKYAEPIVMNQATKVDENNVVIDLGGNTLEGGVRETNSTDGQPKSYYAIDNYGELTIKNATLTGRGIENFTGATLTLGEGVTVKAVDSNGGACIWNEGGTVVINGGMFTATAGDKGNTTDTIKFEPGVINNSKNGTVIINGGTFTAENTGCYLLNSSSGKVTITAGTFKAWRGVVSITGGTCDISGGTFEQLGSNTSGHVLFVAGTGKISMTAGQLIGYSLIGTEGTNNYSIGANVVKTQK